MVVITTTIVITITVTVFASTLAPVTIKVPVVVAMTEAPIDYDGLVIAIAPAMPIAVPPITTAIDLNHVAIDADCLDA